MNGPYEFICMRSLSGSHQSDVSPAAGTNTGQQQHQKTLFIFLLQKYKSGGGGREGGREVSYYHFLGEVK